LSVSDGMTMPALILLLAQAVAASAPQPAGPERLNPHANELFDRDLELRAWALRQFDSNRDGWLTLYEAQPAIRAFERIADGDGDGRVTVYEYREAKRFIAARY
jgi:hypothetical protein